MGTNRNPSTFDCLAKAKPDEPMFVLLGRDPSAGQLVRIWARGAELRLTSRVQEIESRESAASVEWMEREKAKIAEALRVADELDAYARSLGKTPMRFNPSPTIVTRVAAKTAVTRDQVNSVLEYLDNDSPSSAEMMRELARAAGVPE